MIQYDAIVGVRHGVTIVLIIFSAVCMYRRQESSVVMPKLKDFLKPLELFMVLEGRRASAPQRWSDASLQPLSCLSWTSQIYRRDSSMLLLSSCTLSRSE